MANSTNTNPYKVTSKVTIPAAANGTGTIVTQGKAIVGTSTLFKAGGELRRGCWIVDIAADEMRQVDSVESDTLAYLTEAFSSDITSSTPSIISTVDLNNRTISFGILSGLADGEVNGMVFDNGTSFVFTKEGDTKGNFKSFQDPVIVDGTGTTITITIN